MRPLVLQEVLPALLHVVAQPLRPLAPAMLGEEEGARLRHMVGALISYGLSLRPGPAPDSASDPRPQDLQPPLQPPLHLLCSFQGMKRGLKLPSEAVRQIVAHEVTLELIRRQTRVSPSSPTPLPCREYSVLAQSSVPLFDHRIDRMT